MTKTQRARIALLMDGLKACEEIADMIREKIRIELEKRMKRAV